MTNDAYMHRYAIIPAPDNSYYELEPLSAAAIVPSGNGFAAMSIEVIEPETLWSNAPLDESEEWFEPNIDVDEVGRACVDGGVAGAIERLEQEHDIQIGR